MQWYLLDRAVVRSLYNFLCSSIVMHLILSLSICAACLVSLYLFPPLSSLASPPPPLFFFPYPVSYCDGLNKLKKFGRPIAAFTATATDETKKTIIENLGLVDPVTIQSTCNRPNLFYKVLPKGGPHPKEDLVKYVQDNFNNMCGIVYCLSTKDTVELAYVFKAKGLSAVYYHGQLDYFEKRDNATAWLSGKASIMCATSAFGMGIDKPNVRFVIHHQELWKSTIKKRDELDVMAKTLHVF